MNIARSDHGDPRGLNCSMPVTHLRRELAGQVEYVAAAIAKAVEDPTALGLAQCAAHLEAVSKLALCYRRALVANERSIDSA